MLMQYNTIENNLLDKYVEFKHMPYLVARFLVTVKAEIAGSET